MSNGEWRGGRRRQNPTGPPIQSGQPLRQPLFSEVFLCLPVCGAPTSLTHRFTASSRFRQIQEARNSGSVAVSLASTQDNPCKMQTEVWLSLLPEELNTSLGF